MKILVEVPDGTDMIGPMGKIRGSIDTGLRSGEVRDAWGVTWKWLAVFEAGEPMTSPVSAAHPETARKAGADKANTIRWGNQRTSILATYEAALHDDDQDSGLTDEEAGMATGLLQRGAATWMRCHELREAGYIAETGLTRQSRAGNRVMVCTITEAGQAALRAADERLSNG